MAHGSMQKAWAYIAVLFLALTVGAPALAAIQGEVDPGESTAITTIVLTLAPSIQISNVSDIILDVSDRNQDLSFEEGVCVRGNVGGRYRVIAGGGDGSREPFQLQTPAGDRINFELYFRADLSQSTQDRLYPGEASPFYNLRASAADCDGDNSAAFTIIFRSDELIPAQPGVYSGALTLTVAAE